AGDLVHRLALDAQSHDERAELRRRRLAGHELLHDGGGLRLGEVVAVHEPLERVADGEGRVRHRRCSVWSAARIARKLRRMSWPAGVRMDSGWNCTPSTGSSRWRTPMITPLSLHADTSSASGTLSGRMASEW